MAVSSAGPYASLHLALDRYPCQHPIAQFLQARCPSCRPTNSVKALKWAQSDPNYVSRLGLGPVANVCRGPKYYSYATAHDLFLLACTLIRMRYCPLLLLLLLFFSPPAQSRRQENQAIDTKLWLQRQFTLLPRCC